MILILSSDHAIYTHVKHTFSLKEYQAHDLSLLEYLPLTQALPVPVAFHNDTQMLLISTRHYGIEFTSAVLGMVYMIPVHTVLCLAPVQNDSTTAIMPHSLHTSMHTSDNKTTRPLYFDMLLHMEKNATEIEHHTDDTLHSIMSTAAKLWDSHVLHLILLPTHLCRLTPTSTSLSSILIHVCAAVETLPHTTVLPQDYLQWLLEAKKKWQLSSTTFKQLTTLTEGHYQNTREPLPSSLTQLLHTTPSDTCDTKHALGTAKKILMKSLY